MKKKLLVVSTIVLSIFLITGCNEEKAKPTNENEKKPIINEAKDPEPNSSAMVDSLIRKGKSDSKKATVETLNTALDFIKNNIDNLFKDNKTMENVIYYGSILEYYYKSNNQNSGFKDVRGEIGMDAVQAVKYVYRNAEQQTDQHVIENIQQVKEGLAKIK